MDKLFKASALKQSAGVAFGTLVNAALGLAFYLVVIRNLSVSAFGEFSLLLAIGVLAGELGDLGFTSGILKFGHDSDFPKVLTLTFYQRYCVSVVIILIGFLAQLVLGLDFLVSGTLGIVLLFFNLVTTAFQSQEKYKFSVGLNIFCNLLRLLLILVLVYLGALTGVAALWTFVVSYGVAFIAGFVLLIFVLKFSPVDLPTVKDIIPKIMSFSPWVGASQGVAALGAKIDNPMIFAFTGAFQTGLYSGAQKLASIISQFAGVLDSVFAPKLSKNDSPHHFRHFLILASVAAFFILLSIPFASWFVTLVFPPDYQASIPVLEVLLLGYALFFLSTPFASSLVYRYGRSHFHLSGNVLSLALTVVLYLLLLPKFGAMGAAYTFVIVNTVSLVFFAILYNRST